MNVPNAIPQVSGQMNPLLMALIQNVIANKGLDEDPNSLDESNPLADMLLQQQPGMTPTGNQITGGMQQNDILQLLAQLQGPYQDSGASQLQYQAAPGTTMVPPNNGRPIG